MDLRFVVAIGPLGRPGLRTGADVAAALHAVAARVAFSAKWHALDTVYGARPITGPDRFPLGHWQVTGLDDDELARDLAPGQWFRASVSISHDVTTGYDVGERLAYAAARVGCGTTLTVPGLPEHRCGVLCAEHGACRAGDVIVARWTVAVISPSAPAIAARSSYPSSAAA